MAWEEPTCRVLDSAAMKGSQNNIQHSISPKASDLDCIEDRNGRVLDMDVC